MRPVPSLRWEATRAKAGSFSTSVKSSRTKGRSMQEYFSRSGEAWAADFSEVRGAGRLTLLGGTGEVARSHMVRSYPMVLAYPLRSGRVRQVGPPLPLMQSSEAGKVRRSNPAWRRWALVL
jgi:hypothetical protein